MSEILLADAAPDAPRALAHERQPDRRVAVLVGLVVLAALVSCVWTPYDPTVVRPHDSLAGSSVAATCSVPTSSGATP